MSYKKQNIWSTERIIYFLTHQQHFQLLEQMEKAAGEALHRELKVKHSKQ